jgi:hypothetical protein
LYKIKYFITIFCADENEKETTDKTENNKLITLYLKIIILRLFR